MYYIDYITKTIISDVEYISTIFNCYTWYTSPFIIIFFIIWVGIKNFLLLLPVIIFYNTTINTTIEKLFK